MSEYNDRLIATAPTATVEQAIEWARKNGAAPIMIALAPEFWRIAKAKGINPVFSYCQTAYETAYMTFRGCLLDESYKNTAGIKRSDSEIDEIMKKYPDKKSSDEVAECHMKFASWEDSISAQIDHSALYAGLTGYPKKYPKETLDPRHFWWCNGIGKTVLEWAPHYATHSYGDRLLAMMFALEHTEVPKKTTTNAVVTLPTLRSGMYQDSPYSENVRVMQTLVIAHGYSCGEKGADGSFGAATERAVKEFQNDHGLTVDGICGIDTWSALLCIA